MQPTAELRRWTGLAAACHVGPLGNGVRPDTAQSADGADAQSASAPRRRAWSAWDGGVTAGSSAAEVHRQVYAEHEHLHAHLPGTYTTTGSSRGDVASKAATGSPAARWVYGIRCFPRFGYRGEMTGGVGHSRQRWGLDKGAGSEALTGDRRRGGQSSGGVAVPSSSRCSCARRRVRVVGGCCSRGESKREVADGGAHRRGPLDGDGAEVKRTAASGEVERWLNGLFQLERCGDKVDLDGTRGLRSGSSVAMRWRAAAQLSCARVASVQRPIKRCWTLTSGPSAILNFQ
jgi:hypothetical protein